VILHGREFVGRMRAVEDGYRASSDRLDLQGWLRRPLLDKVKTAWHG
jgi:cardiolipin synthase